LKLDYNSESLKFLRQIRNEVHRFGITFHRQKRSKGTFKNELEEIPGIGKSTAEILLKEFRSVTNIREKDLSELEKVVGRAKAKLVIDYWKDKKKKRKNRKQKKWGQDRNPAPFLKSNIL